jgi:hypothetical protein
MLKLEPGRLGGLNASQTGLRRADFEVGELRSSLSRVGKDDLHRKHAHFDL